MKRLKSTLKIDVRLQWRNGFYYATGTLLVLFLLLLTRLPVEHLDGLLPVLVVNNLIVNGFYFMAGLVLLEKGEGTPSAQVVTPLRPEEYLLSKLATLSFLSLAENVAIVLVAGWGRVEIVWLVTGILAGTTFFALAGFALSVRYNGVSDFLLPSLLLVFPLGLPLLPYLGVGTGGPLAWLAYIHPLQGVLVLLDAALRPACWPFVGYSLAYSLLWILLVWRIALRAYRRHVQEATG